MTRPSKRDTVRLSFSDKDRAIGLLRTLARCHLVGETLPQEAELSRTLRIPKSSITLALAKLEAEGLLGRQGSFWTNRSWKDQPAVGTVAFVVNTDVLKGWYSLFQDWLMGFEHTMAGEGYATAMLSGFSSLREKLEQVALARERGIMGMALASRTEPEILDHVAAAAIPAVVLGNATMRQQQIGGVCSDNRGGMEKIVEHLLDLGHRRIACYVNGLGFHDGYRERLAAFQAHLRAHGLNPEADLVFSEPHHEAMARRAAAIFCNLPQKPTAIACATDREAFELVAALRHLHVAVPDQVSVTGFDNNHFTQVLEPAMTTIDIYAYEMGRVAANYLLNEMQAPQMPVKMVLPADLILRVSTKPVEDAPPLATHPPAPVPAQEIIAF